MALTGLMLFGFVIGHLVGNLKLYAGEAVYDAYAEHLRELGAPFFGHGQFLWIFRLVMLAAVALHIEAAWSLTLQNRRARPVGYEVDNRLRPSYASRTMRWGGVIILLFVIYHLLHLTFGTAHPDFEPGKVYQNVVVGFSIPWVAIFYVIANLALGLHLHHGLWSLFQSLGWNHPRLDPWWRRFAALFAVAVTVGNVSFPIAVLTGVVR